jgi:ribosomal-protein-alanine N-acetyltransferase
MVEADLETVQAIEAQAFTTPWSVETFGRLLDRPAAHLLVLEVPPAGVVGYAILWCILDQGELANIALREEWRGRGLGAFLLDRVLEVARERGVRTLFLEVRDSNTAARALYESRGFVEIGRRRDYYEAPREDARVLEKRL